MAGTQTLPPPQKKKKKKKKKKFWFCDMAGSPLGNYHVIIGCPQVKDGLKRQGQESLYFKTNETFRTYI